MDGRAKRALKHLAHASNQRRNIKGMNIKLMTPREDEHALGQGRAALSAMHGVANKAFDGRVGNAPLRDFKAADYSSQQIVEVMRDTAGELPDSFHFLGLKQRFTRAIQSGT